MSTTQFAEFGDDSGASTSLQKIIGAGITIVQVVGSGVAIIMLVVLAIKYISAAPGDKAEIKKHAVVYVIGAIVLFAASGILGIVKNFAGKAGDAVKEGVKGAVDFIPGSAIAKDAIEHGKELGIIQSQDVARAALKSALDNHADQSEVESKLKDFQDTHKKK